MPDNNLPAVQYYTPVELVGIYRSFLERGKSNGVVWLRGIYIQKLNQNAQWAAFYDELRDVDSNVTVTLKINRQDRSKLKSNSLVQVGGIIELNPFQNGTIQIVVNVTRYEIVKDQFVTEQDLKRTEIRIAKSKKEVKNVDAILEDKLFRDERPKVALVFASTSITMQDFNAGVNAAAVKIDFTEKRQSFGNATILATFLQTLDKSGFDVIALVRGGGGGIEALDEIEVLQAVSTMTTPIICAIGHVGEELFMKSIADKVAPTPNGLGQYFSEMVEKVTAKRNNSRAALIEEVKKQFIKQIDESNKKNKELTEKLDKLTKSQAEQMGKLQAQLKTQTDLNAKQSKEFNDNLTKMQKTNSELNTSLQKLTAQNTQAAKDLNEAKERSRQLEKQLEEALSKNKGCSSGCLGIVAAIVTIASAACWIVCLIL